MSAEISGYEKLIIVDFVSNESITAHKYSPKPSKHL